jgi:hypothetical protein
VAQQIAKQVMSLPMSAELEASTQLMITTAVLGAQTLETNSQT